MNLNQITLPVTDMEISAKFYRDLGFTQIVDTPHYARFECPDGESTFSLSLEQGEFGCGAVIYFEHEKLDELVKDLKLKVLYFYKNLLIRAIYGERRYCTIRQVTKLSFIGLVKIGLIHLGV